MVTEEEAREALKQVVDPEVGINIVDMGLVYSLTVSPAEGVIDIEMTLTSPMCPVGPQIVQSAKDVLGSLEGVEKVNLEVVWNPPWSPDMMSEDAKDELGIF